MIKKTHCALFSLTSLRPASAPAANLGFFAARAATAIHLVICYIAIENGHRNSGFTH